MDESTNQSELFDKAEFNSNQFKYDLQGFTGSDSFYRYNLFGINALLTEGVIYLAEKAQCFWLINAILSHQIYKNVSSEPFQVWKLERIVDEEGGWLLSMEDGNDNEITFQEIEFSDFPLDSIVIWFVDGVLMLPTEY